MTGNGKSNTGPAAAVVRGVAKKAVLLTLFAGIAAVFLQRILDPGLVFWRVPAGVVFGSALGVINFRWLAFAVERVYLHRNSTSVLSSAAAVVINVLKLSVIFVVLYIVIQYKLVHLVGVVAGLSVCFLAILWQGFHTVTEDANEK